MRADHPTCLKAGRLALRDGRTSRNDLFQANASGGCRNSTNQAAAVLALDFDALDEIYAEDFLFTHSTGNVDTKATWIEALRTGRSSYTARRVDPIEVETHGSIAMPQAGSTRNQSRITQNGTSTQFGKFAFMKCRTVDGGCSATVRFERNQAPQQNSGRAG